MPTISNPLTGKPVEVLIHPIPDGIAGTPQDATPANFSIYASDLVPSWMFPGLVVHEFSECLMEEDGVPYSEAHKKATDIEKEYVVSTGMDWNKYNGEYLRLLTEIEAMNPPPTGPSDMYMGDRGEPHMKGIPDVPQSTPNSEPNDDPLITLMNQKAKIVHAAIKELYPEFFNVTKGS